MRVRHEAESTRRVLQQLELRIDRRLANALHGDYQGMFPGPGSEAGDGRLYVPGDDVRLIDWNLTARTNQAHVRNPIRDHELEVWLVIDMSASQGFGTRGGQKRELAQLAAAAFGFAACRLANRIGAVLIGDGGNEVVPPAVGTQHLRSILYRTIEDRTSPPRGRTDLTTGLAQCASYAVHRGFVAVVSDFLVAPGWQTQLHRLAQRHSTVAVEVIDPLEEELPAIGLVAVEDPETGAQLVVDTSDAALRARYRAAAAEQRREIARAIGKTGADHLRLHTETDWMSQLVRFFQARRRKVTGYRRAPWLG